MRKFLVLALAVSATASQAIVLPWAPFVPTLTENFDSTAAGGYVSFPGFGGFGTFSRIGTGGLLHVGQPTPFISAPNGMFGRGVDVDIQMSGPHLLFGGRFRQALFGVVPPTTATFRFFDIFNNPIGTWVSPLTPVFTWRGFITWPPYARVTITGNGGLPGYIVMENMRVL